MHSLSPLLKQMCPTLQLWLDVEQGGGNKPEEAVRESEVFFAFLSKDYLASHTCRKELGQAWKKNEKLPEHQKKIVLVRESKSSREGGVESFEDLITEEDLVKLKSQADKSAAQAHKDAATDEDIYATDEDIYAAMMVAFIRAPTTMMNHQVIPRSTHNSAPVFRSTLKRRPSTKCRRILMMSPTSCGTIVRIRSGVPC